MEKSFDYNIGDEVWVIHDNFPIKGKILKIWYTKFISYTDFETVHESELYYVYYQDRKLGQYTLKEMFKTKQDLLKSL